MVSVHTFKLPEAGSGVTFVTRRKILAAVHLAYTLIVSEMNTRDSACSHVTCLGSDLFSETHSVPSHYVRCLLKFCEEQGTIAGLLTVTSRSLSDLPTASSNYQRGVELELKA